MTFWYLVLVGASFKKLLKISTKFKVAPTLSMLNTWRRATTTRVVPHWRAIVEMVVERGGGGPIVIDEPEDIRSEIEIVSTILGSQSMKDV
jgi:hypothetical protein